MNPGTLTLLLSLSLLAGSVLAEDTDPTPEERVNTAAQLHRLPLHYDGELFTGPAWERLVTEASAARFFLVGEEHGIAENPQLIGQLFETLSSSDYSKLVIETSPAMASLLDDALADDGLNGLRALFSQPGGEPAFFGMAQEAEMLARIRAAVAPGEVAFWGTDYEVASDRPLLKLLEQAEKPPEAARVLESIIAASTESWEKYTKTGSPQFIFSFSGDPELVRRLKKTWPDPDERSAGIMNTLEKTLTINNLWVAGNAWASNEARAALQRENFLKHWRAAKIRGHTPRVLAKFGASHMIRGLSPTAVFDLGTLLPELAALEGGQSVSLLILPGKDSAIAALNPASWTYEPRPAKDGYSKGLSPILDAAFDDQFTLFDLRELREVVGMRHGAVPAELFRVIHGFDLLLVMSGSTPSRELTHD